MCDVTASFVLMLLSHPNFEISSSSSLPSLETACTSPQDETCNGQESILSAERVLPGTLQLWLGITLVGEVAQSPTRLLGARSQHEPSPSIHTTDP